MTTIISFDVFFLNLASLYVLLFGLTIVLSIFLAILSLIIRNFSQLVLLFLKLYKMTLISVTILFTGWIILSVINYILEVIEYISLEFVFGMIFETEILLILVVAGIFLFWSYLLSNYTYRSIQENLKKNIII